MMLKKLNSYWFLCIVVLSILVPAFWFNEMRMQGDIDEYALMAEAIADHASPIIRIDDVKRTQAAIPEMNGLLQPTSAGMELSKPVPKAGFYQSKQGSYFAIHFFTYSAIAALPFKIFSHFGIEPVKSFMLVNLAFVLMFALCCRAFFSDNVRAFIATVLFSVCGGVNYCFWLGPEIMSASLLASSILLFFSGRIVLPCVMVGLAATQNPPIILALGFVPLLKWVYSYQTTIGFWLNLRQQFSVRLLMAWGIGVGIFASTIGFNLWAFGIPNIIVKIATLPHMMGWTRLWSFYFDLNQGMLTGWFGLWIALLLLLAISVRRNFDLLRGLLLLLVVVAFSVVLSLPALTTGNWNSGAVGMMRYAFWAGMPFLGLFLIVWRDAKRWYAMLLMLTIGVQVALSYAAFQYNEVQLSWPAKVFLHHAPAFYNPEPEIFVERIVGKDGAELNPKESYSVLTYGKPNKILFHPSNQLIDRQICGNGLVLGPNSRFADAGYGWRYLNGNPQCFKAQLIGYSDFIDAKFIKFVLGWSVPEQNGSDWRGIWSDGLVSVLELPVGPGVVVNGLKLNGYYFEKNHRTRVWLNGKDLGWFDLSAAPTIHLDQPTAGTLKLELQHEFPHDPLKTPEFPDGRRLSVFLRSLTIF